MRETWTILVKGTRGQTLSDTIERPAWGTIGPEAALRRLIEAYGEWFERSDLVSIYMEKHILVLSDLHEEESPGKPGATLVIEQDEGVI